MVVGRERRAALLGRRLRSAVVVVYLTHAKRRAELDSAEAPSANASESVVEPEEQPQLSAAAKKRAKKRAKQAEAKAAEAELAAKIQAAMEEKSREDTRVGRWSSNLPCSGTGRAVRSSSRVRWTVDASR